MSTIGGKIRKLDIYKRPPVDLSTGTNIGGCISILTTLLIMYFLFVEITDYLYPRYKATISEDRYFTRGQMRIYVDIIFPRFPCEVISLDIQDVMLSHHPNIGSIKKWRLNSEGKYIDSTDFQLLREPNINRQYEMAKEAFQKNQGCRLMGSFTVKEVPGNFHISSHAYQNIYLRLQMDGLLKQLNVSHIIEDLHFGEYADIVDIQKRHPDAVLNKLAGYKNIYNITQKAAYNSHYHLDIVPTTYSDGYFFKTETFQYTYNHNSFEVRHMPAVFFNYHIGGLSVSVTPESNGLFAFLVTLCAIVGGTYTLASFLDTILHRIFGKSEYTLIE